MNARGEKGTGQETIPIFAGLGFDYIELPLAQVMDLDEPEFNELLKTIGSEGIPLEACNNFFPPRIRLTGEEAILGSALEYAGRAFERAAAMGAKVIVFGSCGAKNIPAGFPHDRARLQLIELLRNLQDMVKPYNITIALEPVNTRESNFIISAAEGLEIVRELSLDNIKLLIDYYHMRMENEDPRIISRAGKVLRHLHIASREKRLFPKPDDNEDYRGFFDLLKNAEYDGRISIEAKSESLAEDGSISLKLLRSLA